MHSPRSLLLLVSIVLVATLALAKVQACPRAVSSPTRTWIDAQTGQLMVSRPVLKNQKVVYSSPAPLEIRGMGYSPAPPGQRQDQAPFGDFYTQEYDFLWSVDIPRMAEIGVNVVRMWTWKLFDAPNHLAFLDELYRNKMYAIIPFEMLVPDDKGVRTFEDLTKDSIRKDAVRHFSALAKELISHPAVLGFLIGNELEAPDKYGENLVLFFTVINDMIKELRRLEADLPDMKSCLPKCRHLVSTPLKAVSFKQIYEQFFWSNIDFWSVQPYDVAESIAGVVGDYEEFAARAVANNTADRLKPLLLSERGTGSVRAAGTGVDFHVVDDETAQAFFIESSYRAIANFTQVQERSRRWAPALGMVVMEWTDEWWKGFQNTLPIEGCPDDDADFQSDCGMLANPANSLVIAEEHLGMCAHVKYERSVWSTIFLDFVPHELRCKRAFTKLCEVWGGKNCQKTKINRYDNSVAGSSVLILNVAPLACLVVTLIWGAFLLCLKRRQQEDPDMVDGSRSSQSTALSGSVAVDTLNIAKRFNACLDEEVDLTATDPRLEWIILDLLRRADIRHAHDVERFRCLWASMAVRLVPNRKVEVSSIEAPKFQPRKFGESDMLLGAFAESITALHKETMAYVGMHNWRSKFSNITHTARSDEPDVQLQEIVLYYSVRLEHHAIGHAVEFVTENFLTMREVLLYSADGKISDDQKDVAWNALADRVDKAYNIMCNGQMHGRIPVLRNVKTQAAAGGAADAAVAIVTVLDADTATEALQFAPGERQLFRAVAARLELIRGPEYVRTLRPVAVDDEQRLLLFSPLPHGTLAENLRPASGPVNAQGAGVALDVACALDVLHKNKLSHGAVNAASIGYYTNPSGRVSWSLMPSTAMNVLSQERQLEDLYCFGRVMMKLADETADQKVKELMLGLASSLKQAAPISLELCMDQLEMAIDKQVEVPENPPSYEDLNQTALDQRAKHGGKDRFNADLVPFRRSFREQGGLFAALSTYSFFVRYMLWQWIYSWTSQPVLYNRAVCLQRTLEYLAIADALLCTITYASECRSLSGGTHHVKLMMAGIYTVIYGICFVALAFFVGTFLVIEGALPLGPLEVVISAHSIYVIVVLFLFLIKDIARFTFQNGRGEHQFFVKPVETFNMCTRVFRTVLYTINWLCMLLPIMLLTNFRDREDNPIIDTFNFFLPSVAALLLVLLYNIVLVLIARRCKCTGGHWLHQLVIWEQLGAPAIFWALNYFTFNAIMTYLIVPGVAFIDWNLCSDVKWQQVLACNVAWIFNWLSFIIVSFALFGVLYIGWSLLASILVAFTRSIGELHTISDVINNVRAHRARKRIAKNLLASIHFDDSQRRKEAALVVFEAVLDSLVDDHKMSLEEKAKLLNWFLHHHPDDDKFDEKANQHLANDEASNEEPEKKPAKKDKKQKDKLAPQKDFKKMMADRDFRLANEEAEMVLVMFFSSLELLPSSRGYDVSTMPSFTVVIPYFNEIVFHDFHSMRAQSSDLASGIPSDLRHAAAQWPDEWRRLVGELIEKGALPPTANGDELLETYHRICNARYPSDRAKEVIDAVEHWITYRNQTLARNIRGLQYLRRGLGIVARQEILNLGPFGSEEDMERRIETLVNAKMQVLVGAQNMATTAQCHDHPSVVPTRFPRCQLTALLELQAKHPFLEYAFEMELEGDDMTPVERFKDMLEHARTETEGFHLDEIRARIVPLCGVPQFRGTRYYSCHSRLVSATTKTRMYELVAIERPGPLLLGPKYRRIAPRGMNTQGKAENQHHTAQFARGSNFFTLDMNQDMSITEGFKLPTMLHHFLGGNKRQRYGIVGFTERCYTRSTSLSGELAGASEFAFVTIVQRVLRSALRIRMHYGHPDLMSGLLARTIGFNKASHGVNVNEDIFAGYECLARGVRIGFCEWMWFWKGRDTSLRLVAIFNNKLAEGAAQQVRSRDVHFLNANLDWLSRSSLLLGTVGFYWMSVLLYASIRLYIWALVLFEVGGVNNFDIGVANGIISVAWAFQLGYVMALPGLIENTVQYGLLSGIMRFCRFIIPSVFFHSFMLQVTSEGFFTGLFTNAAAYVGTGRGFDLTPVDVTRNFIIWGYSHYWRAVEFTLLLSWYAAVTRESGLSYFIRTITIWVLVASLFGAPFFFQCPPNEYDLARVGSKLWRWVLRAQEKFGSYKNLILPDQIEAVERLSYRTWFARRFATPMYIASLRASPLFNFFELLLGTLYREVPAFALLLCYFSLPMVPLMITASMLFIQAVLLRRMFSGRYQRHFSRIMLITVLVFIVCVTVFYFAARVLFFAPLVSLMLVAYLARFIGVLYCTVGTAQGTPNSFIRAGMRLAILDYPAAISASIITYFLAWVSSKVVRSAVISWNTSARFAIEFRRSDLRRFSLLVGSANPYKIARAEDDWAVGGQPDDVDGDTALRARAANTEAHGGQPHDSRSNSHRNTPFGEPRIMLEDNVLAEGRESQGNNRLKQLDLRAERRWAASPNNAARMSASPSRLSASLDATRLREPQHVDASRFFMSISGEGPIAPADSRYPDPDLPQGAGPIR
jgi:hypothetical protein